MTSIFNLNSKEYLLELLSRINLDETFIIDSINNEEYSYINFFERCFSLSKIINNYKERNIVAILDNSFNLLSLYFAVLFTNKTIYVIDPKKGDVEVNKILESIDDAFVIDDEEFFNFEFIDNLNKEKILSLFDKRDFNSLYLVTFTSGTSGNSKGVEHSFNNLLLTAISLHRKVNTPINSNFLHVMPMTYMAGILNSIFYPLIAEAKIIITKRFSIRTAISFWNTVIQYNANLFWLSPSMLMMINDLDKKEEGVKYCLNNNPIFLVGTAPLSKDLREKIKERYKIDVYASYGLSETLFVSIENKESQKRSNKNNVGELLEGVEYKLIDNNEIAIKVPWMFLEYTNEDTNSYFDGDYYKSGDIAEFDNGNLLITGRSKDLIIKGGINISPSLIEEIINKESDVKECSVVGVKDKKSEERICCFYVSNNKSNKELEYKIKNKVFTELGKNYNLDYIVCVEEIPRNINGKVDKNALRQMWGKLYE